MSDGIKNSKRFFIRVLIGYAIIYAGLEAVAYLTGNAVDPLNAVIITVVVVVLTVFTETILLKSKASDLIANLGLGKPEAKAILMALFITALLFLCYPLISLITGYVFVIPDNWLLLAIGVFALHGIAEEVLYRAYLFRHLRKGRSFSKAAWLAVLIFSLAHIPIIISQGIIVGGMAVLLSVVSSFPFAWLYEKGGNTIWAPAIVHFAIDTVIPIMAFASPSPLSQPAVVLWMAASMVIPYIAFFIRGKNTTALSYNRSTP